VVVAMAAVLAAAVLAAAVLAAVVVTVAVVAVAAVTTVACETRLRVTGSGGSKQSSRHPLTIHRKHGAKPGN